MFEKNKVKKLALVALGTFTAVIAGKVILFPGSSPQERFSGPTTFNEADQLFPRRFELKDKQLRVCIDDVVSKNIPGAAGRFVPSTARLTKYQVYGDMLHYRDRHFFRVDSLMVYWNGTAYAKTRMASLGVWPVDILHIQDFRFSWGWGAVNFLSRERAYDTNKTYEQEIKPTFTYGIKAAQSELTEISAMHTQLLRGVDACLQSTPSARLKTNTP